MSEAKFEVDRDNLEVRITKTFNCEPERLWQAYTDPKQIPMWWQNTTVEALDVKIGGKWRFVDKGLDGTEHAFRGEFLELTRPDKIVRTFEYEPMAGHIMTESALMKDNGDGTTLLTITSKYANLEDLDGMVNSGMERGAVAGVERLAKLVEG